MYRPTQAPKTTISCNNSQEGPTIEAKIRRMMNNNEPITEGAQIIYTERKDGVAPMTNIRTDKYELATEAMDIASKNHLAKREDNHKKFTEQLDQQNQTNSGGAASAQATGNK